jgi:hypothetical protein
LVMGLLLPAIVLGSGPLVTLCIHGEASAAINEGDSSLHHHDQNDPGGAEGDRDGCTWLGPCGVSLSAPQAATGALVLRHAVLIEVPPHPTSLTPRLSPLAYLRPRANPPPTV